MKIFRGKEAEPPRDEPREQEAREMAGSPVPPYSPRTPIPSVTPPEAEYRGEPAERPQAVASLSPAASAAVTPAAAPAYSIDKVIALFRELPLGGPQEEIIVDVTKKSLTSAGVSIEAVVGEARNRESELEQRIKQLGEEIARFEQEIGARRQEIKRHALDLEEVRSVRLRLTGESKQGSASSRPPGDAQPPEAAETAIIEAAPSGSGSEG